MSQNSLGLREDQSLFWTSQMTKVFAGGLCLDVPSSQVSILCITWGLETNDESQASPKLLNPISQVNQIPW